MIRLSKIKNDSKTLSIKYEVINPEKEEVETYQVKSSREPEPEFYAAWTALKRDLPGIMLVNGDGCKIELRQITLKRKNAASEQKEYQVQFDGSVYIDDGVDYQFKTGYKDGFWEPRDKNEEGEYIGTGKELGENTTKIVNEIIERTLAYINGASAQQNLFPENDALDGSEDPGQCEIDDID